MFGTHENHSLKVRLGMIHLLYNFTCKLKLLINLIDNNFQYGCYLSNKYLRLLIKPNMVKLKSNLIFQNVYNHF